MSDQQAEQTKAVSVDTEPVVTPGVPARSETVAAKPAIGALELPRISPDHEAPKGDQNKADERKPELKARELKTEAPRIVLAKPTPVKPPPAVESPKLANAPAVMPTAPAVTPLAPAMTPLTPAVTPKATGKLDANGAEPPKRDVPGRLKIMSAANDVSRAEAAAASFQRAAAALAAKPTASSARTSASQEAAGTAKSEPKPDSRSETKAESKSEVSPQQPAKTRWGFAANWGFGAANKRSLQAAAAVLALALLAGGIGGALGTAAFLHRSDGQAVVASAAGDPALAVSVARIDEDVANLKASLDQTNQASLVELNKIAERLDRVEKMQNEPTSRTAARSGELARLSEAVERLRAAQASATPQSSGREATGSVMPQSQADISQATASQAGTSLAEAGPGVPPASSRAAAHKPDTGNQLKVLDGWVLRDVGRGGALIEGRQGLFEVYAGDPVPGLGKVDAIRRQDGRWVVVTTKGLVVSR